MDPRVFLDILHVAERLKNATRHSYTSARRHESVAEHSWRIALMADLLRSEFPEANMDRVIRMCLIHDLGEAFTGDIPTFDKTKADEAREDALLAQWVDSLPEAVCADMRALYVEMNARQTLEARIYKALDSLEAVIQHNEGPIDTWLPLEYDLNLIYGNDKVAFSDYLTELRNEVRRDTLDKIEHEKTP